jgi:hypothetical protein
LPKRPLTVTYLLFYILFSADTWRILVGIAVAFFLAPHIIRPDYDLMGATIIYIMLASIGYAFSGRLGRWISDALKRLILADRRP